MRREFEIALDFALCQFHIYILLNDEENYVIYFLWKIKRYNTQQGLCQ